MADPAQQASFDKLYNRIVEAVQDLTMLNVVTAVGEVTITDTRGVTDDGKPTQSHTEKCENTKAIITRIDLVDGDIQTFMDTVFASDDAAYSKIRDDHVSRIQVAHDIVNNNVKALKELVSTISDILDATNARKEQK